MTDQPGGNVAKVVVVGSINSDLWVGVERHPAPGETVHGWGGHVTPGGKGANQATAAALLGARVAVVGAVGDDANAAVALSGLEASGADLSRVARVPGPTGVAIVVVAASGENNIIVIPGANASVDTDAVAAAGDLIRDADVVCLQGEIPRAATEAAARLARGRVLLNLAPVLDLEPDVLRLADPLVVNEHEGALTLRSLTGRDDDRDEPATVAALLEAGVTSVVMTLGPRGALVGVDGEVQQVPSPAVEAVDTTGAGDAFTGALAHRLSEGTPLHEAAAFAARVGAFACTREGAQASYPRSTDALPEV